MELIAACTIWVLFGAFLIFPMFGLPRGLHRTAFVLIAAELVAVMMDGLGSPTVATAGRSLAMVDVPLLALALLAVAIMRAWRGAHEDPRHGFAREGRGRGRQRAGRRRSRGDRM